MTPRVFVDGGAGTTGIEIADRLVARPGFEVRILDDVHRKDVVARREALNAADFVILCLPDDAAREALDLIGAPHVRVIDASSAHRVDPGFIYGFPELEPDAPARIASASRVSNPGCYPTGFLALVRPLVRAGLLPPDWPISVNAVSGYSGGGKAMIDAFERGDRATAHSAYALGLAHKHLAEMRVHAGLAHDPIFTPAVARTYRGMLVEVPLHLHALPGAPTLGDVRALLADTYRDSALVSVADDTPVALDIETMAGRDGLCLYVLGDAGAGQARLIAALDNLGKGAAGAAVQSLNLMAGIEATAGLRL